MSKEVFDNYCGSYNIISSGLERLLRTQFFEKKGKLSSEKNDFGLLFLNLTFQRLINCDKPPRTVYNCPQGFLTFTVEQIGSVLQDLRGC